MKNYLPFLLFMGVFIACSKEQAEPDIYISNTTPISKIISSDTLHSGAYWELSIGDSSTTIYQTLQQIHATKKVNYLSIVANTFSKLADIANRIPLYTSLDLNEKNGSATGVQVVFESNKIKAIHLNDGTKLTRWPSNNGNAIALNDQIDQLYPKLQLIQSNNTYASKFERISLFNKDINKLYDPNQSLSPQWHLSVTSADKILHVIFLNFSAGKLSSIYVTKYQLQ